MLNNERLPGDHTYYYLLYGLGSIVGVTDSSGNKVNSYDYDPFGVMLNQQEGVSNPFKFAGGYLDASGFEQFGVRYYSPSLGRWTQQDPVAGSLFNANGLNRYIFVGDDPINQVDPSGKDAITCIGAAFIGLITFDQIGGVTLDLLFGIALPLLAGGPLGIALGGLVLAGAFFAIVGEAVGIYNTIIAPLCGLPSISL